MVVIKAECTAAAPTWAVEQRRLFETMNAAASLFLEKYVHRGGTLRDHGKLDDDLSGNKIVQNEAPHLRFLAGDNPGWPEAILDAAQAQVSRNVQRLRGDTYRHEWGSQTMTAQNPIFTSGLGQMTLGAPFPCFNGGLLPARVRYFDADLRRPGLPRDTAALVERLEGERTVLQLVNTSAMEGRRLIVQGGAYREHTFTEARCERAEKGGEERVAVDGGHFTVELPPATSIRLEIGTRCFVGRPTYASPWSSSKQETGDAPIQGILCLTQR